MHNTERSRSALPEPAERRLRPLGLAGVIVCICAATSVLSPWAIAIRPAHAAVSFGYQTPACWLTVLALVSAVVAANLRIGLVAVVLAASVVIAWFAWALWVVTTPRFALLGFPFVGTDLLGAGWYAAAVGLLVAAGEVVRKLNAGDEPANIDLWLLALLPGFGLMRLGHWGRGLIWTMLFSTVFYLGTIDSPDPALFEEYGATNNVPPALPTRAPEWILLGIAGLFWVLSVVDLVLVRRRAGHGHPALKVL